MNQVRLNNYSPLNKPVKKLQGKKFFGLGQFKELNSGAGTEVFKANSAGVYAGAGKFSDAPFRLSYDGVLRMGLATGSGIGIDGSAGTFDLYYDDVKTGSLSGLQTAKGSETIYVSMSNVVGRSLSLSASGVYCDGTFYPNSDKGYSLGSSNTKWNELWAQTIIAGPDSGAKFSCRGSDGIDAGFDTADGKRANFKGGILYSLS